MAERTFPSVDEVKAQMQEALHTLESLTYHPAGYVISDYPIGGSNRGQCELSAEGAKGKGWRTVRRTTNKYGKWCAPKKSIYFGGLCCVVTGPAVEKEAAWLRIDDRNIYLQSANGESTILAKAPHYCRPSRQDVTHTMTMQRYSPCSAGLQPVGEPEIKDSTIKADPPELCDAYDVWLAARKDLCGLVSRRMKEAEHAASQVSLV